MVDNEILPATLAYAKIKFFLGNSVVLVFQDLTR